MLRDTLRLRMSKLSPSVVNSYIDSAFGFAEDDYISIIRCNQSLQSLRIQIGNRLELFWNDVFHTMGVNINPGYIDIDGKKRQIDHLVQINNEILYMESKCNLDFDTEKTSASNKKLESVALKTCANRYAYFVPVLSEIPESISKRYAEQIISVNNILNMFDHPPFSSEDYFKELKLIKIEIIKDITK